MKGKHYAHVKSLNFGVKVQTCPVHAHTLFYEDQCSINQDIQLIEFCYTEVPLYKHITTCYLETTTLYLARGMNNNGFHYEDLYRLCS